MSNARQFILMCATHSCKKKYVAVVVVVPFKISYLFRYCLNNQHSSLYATLMRCQVFLKMVGLRSIGITIHFIVDWVNKKKNNSHFTANEVKILIQSTTSSSSSCFPYFVAAKETNEKKIKRIHIHFFRSDVNTHIYFVTLRKRISTEQRQSS